MFVSTRGKNVCFREVVKRHKSTLRVRSFNQWIEPSGLSDPCRNGSANDPRSQRSFVDAEIVRSLSVRDKWHVPFVRIGGCSDFFQFVHS